MENFTPWASSFGGLLIALSASLTLLGLGKIAGISGIVARAVRSENDAGWRRAFLLGLVSTGALVHLVTPGAFGAPDHASPVVIVVAGLLVGYGTRLGSGCTSGHGVCGLPRLSVRSLVAVTTFMATGALTVSAMRLFGMLS